MTQADPMTPAERAEIAARAEAATPGPWATESMDGFHYLSHGIGDSLLTVDDDEIGCVENKGDSTFIAHARTDIPRLLAEVERLAAENARLRDASKELLEVAKWAASIRPDHDIPAFRAIRDRARAAIDAAKETP